MGIFFWQRKQRKSRKKGLWSWDKIVCPCAQLATLVILLTPSQKDIVTIYVTIVKKINFNKGNMDCGGLKDLLINLFI